MVLDFVYPAPLCFEEDIRPPVLKQVHYLYFSTMLSFLTLVVVLVLSLATEEPKPEQVNRHSDGFSLVDDESEAQMQHPLVPVC